MTIADGALVECSLIDGVALVELLTVADVALVE